MNRAPYFRLPLLQPASLFAIMVTSLLANIGSADAGKTGEAVLHVFGEEQADGAYPMSDLVADKDGNLYGTTPYGGTGGSGSGTVFKLSPSKKNGWTEQVLYAFQGGADGDAPLGGLAIDKKGNLYGTTQHGGTGTYQDGGTVFELSPPANGQTTWTKTTLYNFCSQQSCTDGQEPMAGVTLGPNGILYGTTDVGGLSPYLASTAGVIYELVPSGKKAKTWTETVLYNFCTVVGCADGYQPLTGRLLLTSGLLIGTTTGSDQGGTVFALDPQTSQLTIIHDFSLSNGDGRGPYAGVVEDGHGTLYGTTEGGGAPGCGTVFSVSRNGSNYQQIYAFCATGDHSDGVYPYAGVTLQLGKDGNPKTIYGTTYTGGLNNAGVAYALTPNAGAWNQTLLYDFCALTNCTDGGAPAYGNLLLLHRSLYGTTQYGGSGNGNGSGTVFSLGK